MAIAKTASRNVAFKVAKMREAIMMDQDEFLMRTSDQTEAGLERANATFLDFIAATFLLSGVLTRQQVGQ